MRKIKNASNLFTRFGKHHLHPRLQASLRGSHSTLGIQQEPKTFTPIRFGRRLSNDLLHGQIWVRLSNNLLTYRIWGKAILQPLTWMDRKMKYKITLFQSGFNNQVHDVLANSLKNMNLFGCQSLHKNMEDLERINEDKYWHYDSLVSLGSLLSYSLEWVYLQT